MTTTMATSLIAVREALAETVEREWSQIELRRWINEGAREVARKTLCLPDRKDIAMVVGTQEYTAPTDAVMLHRVEVRENGNGQVFTLDYRDFNTMDAVWWTHQSITQSRPMIYTQWGFPPSLKLVLYPKPAVAGSIKVFYFRFPAAIATDGSQDAATIEVPEGWEDSVWLYAEYRALRKDRDPRWQEAKSLYEEKVNDLYTTALRYSDQAGMVVADTAMIPSWLYEG